MEVLLEFPRSRETLEPPRESKEKNDFAMRYQASGLIVKKISAPCQWLFYRMRGVAGVKPARNKSPASCSFVTWCLRGKRFDTADQSPVYCHNYCFVRA